MRNTGSVIDLVRVLWRLPTALASYGAERKHRKMMRGAPAYSIAEMPESTFGKIVGRARPSQKRLLEAPLSGRLCVYYEVAVDAITDGMMTRVLGSEQEGMAFVLEDGTARAYIDPATAMMSTAIDFVSSSTQYLMSDRERAVIDRLGLSKRIFGSWDGLRYREAIIEADERIAVYGSGVREPDPDAVDASYRGDGAPTRLCLTGTERFPLFISDDPRVIATAAADGRG